MVPREGEVANAKANPVGVFVGLRRGGFETKEGCFLRG